MKNWALYRKTAIDRLRAADITALDDISAHKLGMLCARELGYKAIGKLSRAQGRRLTREYAEREAPEIKQKAVQAQATKDTFYLSGGWRAVRYEALRRHGGRCQCCGRSAADGVQIHVDHIKPRSKFPELALDVNNLQVLCEDCNLGKSNTDATDWRPKIVINNG